MRLILASASPRRADLLTQAGYLFEIWPAEIDERVRDAELPEDYVRRLALQKSAAVARLVDRARRGHGEPEQAEPEQAAASPLVLAADTAVVVDGEILGKPVDAADAAGMIRKLSGRPHEVLTGVSLRSGGSEIGQVEATTVWMSPLSLDEIAWYVATGEGSDKAGGYAIQGLASRFIPRIAGSYTNVVGLPVALVHELVEKVTRDHDPALHRGPKRAILSASRSRKSL